MNDKSDILDMVRKRMKERGIKPMDIRRAGVSKWSPLAHWRLFENCYDNSISIERAYQLAISVGLRRTKTLPFSLYAGSAYPSDARNLRWRPPNHTARAGIS